MNKIRMDTIRLPEICEDMEVLGMYKDIPVTVAIGDNQASFLGAAGSENNTLLVNMGTGGQISVLTDQYFETEGIEASISWGKYLLVGASCVVVKHMHCLRIFQVIYEGGNRTGYTIV